MMVIMIYDGGDRVDDDGDDDDEDGLAPGQHVCTVDDVYTDFDVDGDGDYKDYDGDYKDYDDDDDDDDDNNDEQHLGSMSVLLTAAVGVERQH